MTTSARSYLYVPGNRPDRFDKALGSGADAIVLDLEDAVAPADKQRASEEVERWLSGLDSHPCPIWIRVNADDRQSDDVVMAVRAGADGIFVPKCDEVQALVLLDYDLVRLENEYRRTPLAVSPLLETAQGILDAPAIAAAPRVAFLQIGEVDLAADLDVEPSPSGEELLWARSRVVMASVAAQISSPLGAASPNIRDTDAFADETRRLRRLGFFGRACIHPTQIATVHAVNTPSQRDIDAAAAIVQALETAVSGVATDANGNLIDEAVVRSARRVLARASN